MTLRHGARGSAVPVHSLYGEEIEHDVDFIHIERLRSRSELFDWSIDAHSHAGLVQVMFISGGAARVMLDETVSDLPAPAVITTPSGVVHSFDLDPESSGFVVTLADNRLDGVGLGGWIRQRLFDRGMALSLELSDPIVDRLHVFCEEMIREHEMLDTGGIPIMEAIGEVILLTLARRVDAFYAASDRRRPHDRFREFRMAVEEHYAEHWPLNRYADLLHMSESSLNRICRAVANTTAFEIVQRKLELEARRRLIYSGVPIHRLAMDLGFTDASYFSRFFRRRTGMAPGVFRRERQPV